MLEDLPSVASTKYHRHGLQEAFTLFMVWEMGSLITKCGPLHTFISSNGVHFYVHHFGSPLGSRHMESKWT